MNWLHSNMTQLWSWRKICKYILCFGYCRTDMQHRLPIINRRWIWQPRKTSCKVVCVGLLLFGYSYIMYYIEYYPCGGAVWTGSRAISPFGRRPTVGAYQSGGSISIAPRGGFPARPGSDVHGRFRKTRKSRPTRAFRNSTAIPAGQAPDGFSPHWN